MRIKERGLSFKSRVAFSYIVTTALLIGAVFVAVFVVARISVSTHLNHHLEQEAERHYNEVEVKDGTIALKRHAEWMEREHNTIDVSPVFIEFLDSRGNLIDKSPNLKGSFLLYNAHREDFVFFDSSLAGKRIKQVQVPITDELGERVGHLLVAVSSEEVEEVVITLRNILLLAYPIILVLLFFWARIVVGRNLRPVHQIIEISARITRENLTSRIPLPTKRDELYTLSETINNLLNRIENAIESERSFTSYASHEFRTPLSILKGTLEVLIRKPRSQQEYEEEIKSCIGEIDRLNHLVDELLFLARFENQKQHITIEPTPLKLIIEEALYAIHPQVEQKNMVVKTAYLSDEAQVQTDGYLLSIVMGNLLSNAIKYSHRNGTVEIKVEETERGCCCEITDHGIGIDNRDLPKIFDKFYRSSDHPNVDGFGLGLPIVKAVCTLLHIDITLTSELGRGTTLCLHIPSTLHSVNS